MSHKIARLLDKPEQIVASFINQLEAKNGAPSHDVRLLAENISTIRLKLAQLGLDPDDTTGAELYHALLVQFHKTAALFELQLGTENQNFDSRSARAADLVGQNFELPKRWALKNSAAKNILRRLPPKRTMKRLGYRSVESMLKRENLAEIYLGAQAAETASWQKDHARAVSKLDQTDFELRRLSICLLNYDRWGDIDSPAGFAADDQTVAAIGLWPSDGLQKAPLLSMCLLLMEAAAACGRLEPAAGAAKLSGVLEWWADMDQLVAELGGEPVSLNLKDACLNSLTQNPYEQRQLEHGRAAFWHELLSRYDHLPAHEAPFDSSIRQRLAELKFKAPEPVYEFAEEEFDG